MFLPSILIYLTVIQHVKNEKILAIFTIPSHSHQIVYRTFTRELSRRGHDLTVVTTDPIKKSDYKEIDISYAYDYWKDQTRFSWLLSLSKYFPEVLYVAFGSALHDFCHMYLSDPNLEKLIKENETFDLLIIEWKVSLCLYPLVSKCDNKMIGIYSLSVFSTSRILLGSTSNPAYVPEHVFPYTDKMSFSQRLRTLTFQMFMFLYWEYLYWDQNKIAEQYFRDKIPHVRDIEKNVSLLLVNSHFSTSFPKPNVPNIVDIGGPPFHLHDYEPGTLPKDIQEFLDDAKEGVIYFSLGSNVKSSTMPESKRAVFLEAFKKIKQKVLWKWETDDLPGKPDNVKLGKWLPQTDILAHPNIKLFITQGGLQSMGEATHNEIPMIVIPFFADQELNAKKLVSVGVAIRLDFETITTEELENAINEIINNKEYKKNIEKYSALTKDQPQSPMERAVWWTEYVLRHNGARHLRSAAVDMPWYQYFLLDVIAFLLAVALIAFYLTYLIVRTFVRLIFGKSKKTKKD